jgi:FHS family L-fucose permease-like MFS transporter
MSNPKESAAPKSAPALLPQHLVFPFILVTTLFALWGFANDVTNPLVKVFKDVFVINNTQSSLVQTAFYGGYATMALPAALFIRRFSYKAGIIVGLCLYAGGAFLCIPAAAQLNFNLFLVALYVLTFGLAFLETTANPFILSMGPGATATRRLNLAQAFNPIGSLTGMVVASTVILGSLQVSEYRADVLEYQKVVRGEVAATAVKVDPGLEGYLNAEQAKAVAAGASLGTMSFDSVLDKSLADFKAGQFASFQGGNFESLQRHDLNVVKLPYVIIGMVVVGVMLVFILVKMPEVNHEKSIHLVETFKMLLRNKGYVEGVLAQGFYVGAQIMCWTFIIHYATTNLNMTAAEAQNYNIIAMVTFCCSRFICTFMLKYISPGKLLMFLAAGGIVTSLGTIFLSGMAGLWCLIAISACMSLMFPTIYGIALDGMGEESKIASAGLIFAIVGGALMPPLQGRLIDLGGATGKVLGLSSVSFSFVLPLACFVFIAFYGYRTFRIHERNRRVA